MALRRCCCLIDRKEQRNVPKQRGRGDLHQTAFSGRHLRFV